jgi:hypothetical protein
MARKKSFKGRGLRNSQGDYQFKQLIRFLNAILTIVRQNNLQKHFIIHKQSYKEYTGYNKILIPYLRCSFNKSADPY